MILIKYLDGFDGERKTIECDDLEDAKTKLYSLISEGTARDIDIYQCDRLFWKVDIFGMKEIKNVDR